MVLKFISLISLLYLQIIHEILQSRGSWPEAISALRGTSGNVWRHFLSSHVGGSTAGQGCCWVSTGQSQPAQQRPSPKCQQCREWETPLQRRVEVPQTGAPVACKARIWKQPRLEPPVQPAYLGGGGTGLWTLKQSPWAWLGPWYGSCPKMTTFTCEHQTARIKQCGTSSANGHLAAANLHEGTLRGQRQPPARSHSGSPEGRRGTWHCGFALPSSPSLSHLLQRPPSPTRMSETTGDQLCFHPLRFSNYKRSYTPVTGWPSRNRPSGHSHPMLTQLFMSTRLMRATGLHSRNRPSGHSHPMLTQLFMSTRLMGPLDPTLQSLCFSCHTLWPSFKSVELNH